MLNLFHALRRDEEGQSLVIACVAMLILALGVMTTINLGRAVHQRIGLQQTADASAYSMAVMEARTFNFYAFTNRAQIAHYVAAMCVQGIISFITFIIALLSEFVAILMTLDFCQKPTSGCEAAACGLLSALTGGAYDEFDEFVRELKEMIIGLNEALDGLDVVLGKVPPLLQMMNKIMYGFAKIYGEAMLPGLLDGEPELVDRNDDQVSGLGGARKAAAGALTQRLYNLAHMYEAGGQPGPPLLGKMGNGTLDNIWHDSGNAKREQAKRAMSEVANASRHTDDLNFLTDRDPLDMLPIPGASFLDKLLKDAGGWAKVGQSKLTTVPLPDHRGGPSNCIHTTGVDHGQVTQGNVLGADDIFFLGIPILEDVPFIGDDFKWGDKHLEHGWPGNQDAPIFNVSVWADRYDGQHFRPDPTNPFKSKKVPPIWNPVCQVKFWHVNYKEMTASNGDGNHHWDGITPFMQFDVTGSQGGFGQKLFYNQPSTWAFLDKSYDQTTRDKSGGPDMLQATERKNNFTVATNTGPATIDTTNQAKTFAPLADGSLNVLSRGMAYYHRPRNWEEPPNFFNPYWRAKLDPVVIGLPQAENAVPGGNAMSALTSKVSGPIEKVLVH